MIRNIIRLIWFFQRMCGRCNVEENKTFRGVWQRTGLTKTSPRSFGLMEPGGGVQIPTAALRQLQTNKQFETSSTAFIYLSQVKYTSVNNYYSFSIRPDFFIYRIKYYVSDDLINFSILKYLLNVETEFLRVTHNNISYFSVKIFYSDMILQFKLIIIIFQLLANDVTNPNFTGLQHPYPFYF